MKLENYSPISRQVLYREEVAPEKVTQSGIILPANGTSVTTFADQFENEKVHTVNNPGDLVVVKIGKDCLEIKPGDVIILPPGSFSISTKITLDDKPYFTVMEHQVLGYSRQ